jgi:hypothetical protein
MFAVLVGKAGEGNGKNGAPHVGLDEVADEAKGVVEEDLMTTMIDVIMVAQKEIIEAVEDDRADTTIGMTMTEPATAMVIALAHQVITRDHHLLHKDDNLLE